MTATYYDESYPAGLWGAGAVPLPTLTTIAPATKVMNTAGFTITCTGTGFTSGGYILFDGVGMATTYVSPTSMTAAVPASSILSPARTVQVTALVPGFQATAGKPFTITATQRDAQGPAEGATGPQEAPEGAPGPETAQEAPEAPQGPTPEKPK